MNKYVCIMSIVIMLLIGLAGAISGDPDEFEHKEFTNSDGVFISYDINYVDQVRNGILAIGNTVYPFEQDFNTQVIYYTNGQGKEGIIHVKPYDGTVFDVDLIEKESGEVLASYRFVGNFLGAKSMNMPH